MKQLLHTACPGGKRIDAPTSSGYGIRTVTPGVSARDWLPLIPVLGFEFPRGQPADGLVRLSLVEVAGRRVLLHSVRGGEDQFSSGRCRTSPRPCSTCRPRSD